MLHKIVQASFFLFKNWVVFNLFLTKAGHNLWANSFQRLSGDILKLS